MAFLLPIIGSLASSVIPYAVSWIGKKIAGTALGNAASHHMAKNPQF